MKQSAFILVLLLGVYEAGVWIGQGILYPSSYYGFFAAYLPLWVGAAIASVVLVFRLLRSRISSQQPGTEPVPTTGDPEVDSFESIVREARLRLRDALVSEKPTASRRLDSLPLYLLIGPPGAGKTSIFTNAGLTAGLLSGTAQEGASPPTAVANIWYAHGAIFVEIAGRLFNDDLLRWKRLVQVLSPRGFSPLLNRLGLSKAFSGGLRGVLLFCEAADSLKKRNSHSDLAETAHKFRERLAVIASVFRSSFPVYVVLSKCDRLRHCAEFLARVTDEEEKQAVGYTFEPAAWATSSAGDPFAVLASSNISKALNRLYTSLAEKRREFLSRETNRKNKASIYEFPRELRKLREALVELLSGVFRPDPLRPGPVLRGFYLIGTRRVPGTSPHPAKREDLSETATDLEATSLLRETPFLETIRSGEIEVPRRGETLITRFCFSSELFTKIIHTGPPSASTYDRLRLESSRRLLFAAGGAACLLFAGLLIRSWYGNVELLNWANDKTAIGSLVAAASSGGNSSFEDLETLDRLRERVGMLNTYSLGGPPWRLRWGFYTGDDVLPALHRIYFRRFRTILLEPATVEVTLEMSRLPATPGPHDPYSPVHDRLKTYLMTRSQCAPERNFLTGQLMNLWKSTTPNSDGRRAEVVERQIQFYAGELEKRRDPYRLETDVSMVSRARQYLSKLDVDRRAYRAILDTLTQRQRNVSLTDIYSVALTGPGQISESFTQEGRDAMEGQLRTGNIGNLGDDCVLGKTGAAGIDQAQLQAKVRALYYQDYLQIWAGLLDATHVTKFADAPDAARKLEMLASNRSPLLALLRLVADNTRARPKDQASGLQKVQENAQEKLARMLGNSIDKVIPPTKSSEPIDQSEHVARTFQPVHVVAPLDDKIWIGQNNQAYVEALRGLQGAMQKIAESPQDPASAAGARASIQAARDAVVRLSQSFTSVGGPPQVDAIVKRLLEEPIENCLQFIPPPPGATINSALREVCSNLYTLQRKFPFQSSGNEVSLEEFSKLFAPAGGRLWSFHQKHLSKVLVEQDGKWVPASAESGPQLAPDFVNFFSKMASVSKAFFPHGGSRPSTSYTLMPLGDPRVEKIRLEIDGVVSESRGDTPLPGQFSWPVSPDKQRVRITISSPSVTVTPVSHIGAWAIFKAIRDAELRGPGSPTLVFSRMGGGTGQREPIMIGPTEFKLRFRIPEFPGGVPSAFDADFFSGLRCPPRATQ